MKTLRENLPYLLATIVVFLVAVIIAAFINGGGFNTLLQPVDGNQVYGIYQSRKLTSAGNFLVTYEYPENWILIDNGIQNEAVTSPKTISVYYVFEKPQQKYSGGKKNFNEKAVYWSSERTELIGDERRVVDVLWPVESIHRTVRFTCMGPELQKETIEYTCQQFVRSFRLD